MTDILLRRKYKAFVQLLPFAGTKVTMEGLFHNYLGISVNVIEHFLTSAAAVDQFKFTLVPERNLTAAEVDELHWMVARLKPARCDYAISATGAYTQGPDIAVSATASSQAEDAMYRAQNAVDNGSTYWMSAGAAAVGSSETLTLGWGGADKTINNLKVTAENITQGLTCTVRLYNAAGAVVFTSTATTLDAADKQINCSDTVARYAILTFSNLFLSSDLYYAKVTQCKVFEKVDTTHPGGTEVVAYKQVTLTLTRGTLFKWWELPTPTFDGLRWDSDKVSEVNVYRDSNTIVPGHDVWHADKRDPGTVTATISATYTRNVASSTVTSYPQVTVLSVEASSVFSGTYAAANILDGNWNTFWRSAGQPIASTAQRLRVKLNAVNTINRVSVSPQTPGLTYQLLVSTTDTDGATLTDDSTYSPVASGILPEGNIEFDPARALYIKFIFTGLLQGTDGRFYAGLRECDVFSCTLIDGHDFEVLEDTFTDTSRVHSDTTATHNATNQWMAF